MTIGDEIPWIFGEDGRPDIIYDENRMKNELHISNHKGEKIADYYAHYRNCKWVVVEGKKDRYRTIEKITRQLIPTVDQLKQQGKPVHYIIIVRESLDRESKAYDIDPITHEIIKKISPTRSKLEIRGITIRFFRHNEVYKMRGVKK